MPQWTNNACRKLSHDTLDGLGTALRSFVDLVGEIPGLMKADVDAAFRRIPLRADQRWACGIVFVIGWQVTFGLCAQAS